MPTFTIVPTVNDIHSALQELAPDSLAESWDNVGILAGSRRQAVHRVMVALDPCVAVANQAAAAACDLIITHHPAIFRPIRQLAAESPEGPFLLAAIRHNISVIACHTSLDSAEHGVNQSLAQGLGLTAIRPLAPASVNPEKCGLGAIGCYPVPISPEELVSRIVAFCRPPWILAAGQPPKQVGSLALCGGSGSEFAELALTLGADAYLTAELKHNVARWAEEAGLWVLDAGHFPTENPAMPLFAARLRELFATHHWEIPVDLAAQETPLGLLWPRSV